LLKNGNGNGEINTGVLENTAVKNLSGSVSKAQRSVLNSGVNYAPSTLTQYTFDLAQSFNTFYQEVEILEAPEKDRGALLAIVRATMLTLGECLKLMGIEVVDEM
jgi:arginyl-tRNA synthetase